MQPDNVWLIHEPALSTLAAVVEKAPEAVMTRQGRKMDGASKMMTRGNVAVIPIHGVVFPRSTGLTDWVGEFISLTTIDTLARDFQAAMDNPSVTSIMLDVDSPGGQVTGVNEMAAIINASSKPVAAYVNGMGASAAYWMLSAADEVVVDATTEVGSIGTVIGFVLPSDRSKTVEIVSTQSPKKRADPTTDEGRAEYQRIVDAITDVFVGAVAKYRGVSTEKVLSDFGQGGLRVGADAVKHGMADRVGSMEQMIDQMNRNQMPKRASHGEEMTAKELVEKIKALVTGEPAAETVAEPTPEQPDATALLAELETLRAEKAQRDAEASEKLATERAERIKAEVSAFESQHCAHLGEELRTELVDGYRAAKESGDEAGVARIEAIAAKVPAPGPTERVKAGGEKVEEEVARAAGEPIDVDAERDAKIKALAKSEGISYAEAHTRVLKAEAESGA